MQYFWHRLKLLFQLLWANECNGQHEYHIPNMPLSQRALRTHWRCLCWLPQKHSAVGTGSKISLFITLSSGILKKLEITCCVMVYMPGQRMEELLNSMEVHTGKSTLVHKASWSCRLHKNQVTKKWVIPSLHFCNLLEDVVLGFIFKEIEMYFSWKHFVLSPRAHVSHL